ncbi:MAG: CvpA family protein [Bacteroidota bacterium]
MEWLEGRLGEFQSMAPFVAFIGIFIIIVVLVNLLGRALKSVLDLTLLGSLDKFVGALVGLLKWAFGASIVLWLLELADIIIPQEVMDESLLFPYLVSFAPWVVEMASALLPFAQDLIDQIKSLFPGVGPIDPSA